MEWQLITKYTLRRSLSACAHCQRPFIQEDGWYLGGTGGDLIARSGCCNSCGKQFKIAYDTVLLSSSKEVEDE